MTRRENWLMRMAGLVLCLVPVGLRAAEAPTPAAPATAVYLNDIAPPGWQVRGTIESYTPANLYDKINGRSELYMAYAIARMSCVTLVQNDTNQAIDVFLYDMQTALSAFGVYSMERTPGAPSASLGRLAYHEDGALYVWEGSHYLTLRGSGSPPPSAGTLLETGRTVVDRLPKDDSPLWGATLLPATGQMTESLQYFMADALALDFLTDTFTAEYAGSPDAITVFVSRAETPGAARQRRDQFIAHLDSYGTNLKRTQTKEGDLVSAEMFPGTFDVVFLHGNYLGGVTSVAGRKRALDAALALRDGLRIPHPHEVQPHL